jgi:hypothetical protein
MRNATVCNAVHATEDGSYGLVERKSVKKLRFVFKKTGFPHHVTDSIFIIRTSSIGKNGVVIIKTE